MSKKNNGTNQIEPVVQNAQQYSKSAFVDAAENNKEKLIMQVVLEEDKKYTPQEVSEIVNAWKKKEVK